MKNRTLSLLATGLILLLFESCSNPVKIRQVGDMVSLSNEKVKIEYGLKEGSYQVIDMTTGDLVVQGATLGMNGWTSKDPAYKAAFTSKKVSDEFGRGNRLILEFRNDSLPDYRFTFSLYDDRDFLDLSASVRNNSPDTLILKEICPLNDGILYPGQVFDPNFAMVDGFSGGEPLEYGRRLYSPVSRENALKSRNNILLTFGGGDQRKTLVMGGLTYHDFDKYAFISQPRRVELEKGSDGKNSLLAYLNLPDDTIDQADGKPGLKLISKVVKRRWDNNEFRCTETAESAVGKGEIRIMAGGLEPGHPYYLGISWWRGMRHGDRKDHRQSVYVEYSQNGRIRTAELVKNKLLPRFDGVRKEDVQQVELPIPPDVVNAGEFNIVIEKTPDRYDHSALDPNAYLSEIWLRDGISNPLLPDTLTSINDCIRHREQFSGRLFAMDPVGKRIDPGSDYECKDRFYLDISTRDPLISLEKYGRDVQVAQQVELSMYDFPTVCLWYAENSDYGGSQAENSTRGAVNEMKIIRNSGFLKYSRAAVRLVPDSYLPDNQQGWWDDKHWQMENTDRNASHNGRYVEPYETSEKWGKAVTDLGGIPLTYFQAGFRSEDYAKTYPGHMLFNKTYAWRGQPQDTASELFTTWNQTWTRNRVVWGYDYTDPGFLHHLEAVYKTLASGGIKGLMFDYPASGWASGGGMEDRYSTAAAAYRNIFRMPYEGLGPGSYVHERNMERGTDISIGYVASMRTENDTDEMDAATVTRCGLRWYKNRVLYNQDTDSKNIARLQDNRDRVRAVLTMAYVTTGRLLLANSFDQFTPETFRDITRTFPYQTEHRSARPADAFVSDVPMVYDYPVNEDWHQVTFFNPDPDRSEVIGIAFSGHPVDGALAMDPDARYHVFDFWNDRYVGILDGTGRLEQDLRPGEARMMSVHRVMDHPQVLSTNRHIMQGYLDLDDVRWTTAKKTLSGKSRVVGNDPYVLTIATNGLKALQAFSQDPAVKISLQEESGLAKVILESDDNREVGWSIQF